MLKPIGSNKHRSYFRKSEMPYDFKCIKFFLNSSYFDKAMTQETAGGPKRVRMVFPALAVWRKQRVKTTSPFRRPGIEWSGVIT